MRHLPSYWTCQIAGWGLYAVVNIGLGLAYMGTSMTGVGFGLVVSALGLATTHGLRSVIRSRDWMKLSVAPLAVRMIGASLMTALAMAAIVLTLTLIFNPEWTRASPVVSFLGMSFNFSALVLLWSAIYTGVHLVDRWRESERQRGEAEAERWRLEAVAREAELRALQAQVNPHFLFNSLNTVRALITENPDEARQAVTDLADLLRYALAAERRERVPLAEEIETVRRYLAIEQLRFEHRLQTSVEIEPDALAASVPPMVIQTLVENGIKHGIDQTPDGGGLRVAARSLGDHVRVTVDSPGRLDTSSTPESGVGLANATERLQRLCGDWASLTVVQASADVVRAEVVIPLSVPELA